MDQAIRPNYFSGIDSLASLQPLAKDELELNDEIKQLHYLARTSGWRVFKERAGEVMQDLDNLVMAQITAKADEASIGRSAIVKEITKDVIRRLLNIVQDAYDSVESRKS